MLLRTQTLLVSDTPSGARSHIYLPVRQLDEAINVAQALARFAKCAESESDVHHEPVSLSGHLATEGGEGLVVLRV